MLWIKVKGKESPEGVGPRLRRMTGVTYLRRRQLAEGLKVVGEQALLFGNSVSEEEARTSELGAETGAG